MKTIQLILLALGLSLSVVAQDQIINGTLSVKNPNKYPFGININVDYTTNWSREFNIGQDKESLFSFGVLVQASTLTYGYIGGGATNNTNYTKPWMAFKPNGYVGIGTTTPQALLDVRGKIIADQVEVKVNTGADFVFAEDYALKPLAEVAEFVKENKHLPEIPSEKEMQENGLNVNEFQIKLLQKIEELTLYVIEQDKKYGELKKENEEMKNKINNLKNK